MKKFLLLLVALVSCCSLWADDKVDTSIPVTTEVKDKTFVLVISNENYKHEESVPFANNDGEVFAVYCEKTLGVPAKNIHRVPDATLNDMNHELEWLTQVVKAFDGQAQAIFYYSGHGMPDEASKEAYLLPTDAYSSDPKSGLSTKKLYDRLNSMQAQRTLVFLDACFSGSKRDGEMMASSRGVAIKAKTEPVKGNMVVFSAAQGNETAYPYKGNNHGMFTYFVLNKLNETGGAVTLGELSDYVIKEVKQKSIVDNGKSQTPSINGPVGDDSWRSWRFAERAAKTRETRVNTATTKASKDGPAIPSSAEPYTIPDYTIEGAGTGVQGTYLVKVTLDAKRVEDATDQELTKAAIHGVLFRGFESGANRQHQRPLAGSALVETQNSGFFSHFFHQPYQQYGQAETTSRQVVRMGKNQFKVSATVTVKEDQLRKDLTTQGILKGDLLGESKRPTLMVIPADSWCTANGFVKDDENGKKVSDYEAAWSGSQDLFSVVSKIGELMTDRGFPLKDLSQSLKNVGAARTDIFLEVGWKINKTGPKNSVTYTLRGLDAYTMKQVANTSGTGKPSFSAEVPVLLEEAVLERMDNFAGQLQQHFDDLLKNGREVAVTIRCEGAQSLEFEYDGKELTEIIDDWMALNTLNHRYSMGDNSDKFIEFEQVRIPLYAQNGMPLDTRRWLNSLRKMLSAEPYNIAVQIVSDGLGHATLVLGNK